MGKWNNLMVRDMELKGLAKRTVYSYRMEMKKLVKFYMIEPDKLSLNQVLDYLHHLYSVKRVSNSTMKCVASSVKFFYRYCVERTWDFNKIPYPKSEKKLPEYFNRSEIKKILANTGSTDELILYMTLYSTGMRIGEARRLMFEDLDTERMVFHIKLGKGGKDRFVPVTEDLCEELRKYFKWLNFGRGDLIFRGSRPDGSLCAKAAGRRFNICLERAGINKRAKFHSFRHSFATHLFEDGTSLLLLQRLLGHADIRTTMIYTHLANNFLDGFKSPLDRLNEI
ncbi:tyrosine-type recombinase/integrase [bacterium]|nr:tyrosine-type recombinase/integrase [bacterium]